MIFKWDLKHGVYYRGVSRRATVARWNSRINRFVYWRVINGVAYLETSKHYEDIAADTSFTPEVVEHFPNNIIPIE